MQNLYPSFNYSQSVASADMMDLTENKYTSIYVAGKWSEKKQIREYMNQFKKAQILITYDWTVVEQGNNPTEEQKAGWAKADVEGVRSADYLVIILTDKTYPYRGTSTELGVALGLNIPVIIVELPNYTIHASANYEFNKNIFTKHELVTVCYSIQQAIQLIKTI